MSGGYIVSTLLLITSCTYILFAALDGSWNPFRFRKGSIFKGKGNVFDLNSFDPDYSKLVLTSSSDNDCQYVKIYSDTRRCEHSFETFKSSKVKEVSDLRNFVLDVLENSSNVERIRNSQGDSFVLGFNHISHDDLVRLSELCEAIYDIRRRKREEEELNKQIETRNAISNLR